MSIDVRDQVWDKVEDQILKEREGIADMVDERVMHHIAFGLWLNMGNKVRDGVWLKVGHYLDVDIRRRRE